MTLTLTPDAEERLRRVADQNGLAPKKALTALLDRALADAEAETEATLAELRASEEDFAAGRWICLEELTTRLQAKAESRRGQ